MDELASLKLPELKKECKSRGLSTSGNKADLVSRLQSAMSTEKPPSDDSVLDDAIIDEDSMLDDDDESGVEDSSDLVDLNLTTNAIDLSSPTSKTPPTGISKSVIGSPSKLPVSPIKKVEAVKRPAISSPSKTHTNGDPETASPATKKKITINRESVQAPPVIETERSVISMNDDQGEKKVVKIGSAPLTAEEKAALRAQKFGISTSAVTPAAAVSAKSTPAPIVDEKLKKRADRFNNGTSSVATSESKVVSLTTEDDVKLAKRKERFGLVDESEKKETRAARFGAGVAATVVAPASTTTTSTDSKSIRAARFGNTAT